MAKAITGTREIATEDLPDRPNYAHWVAIGTRYPYGYTAGTEALKYRISGRSLSCLHTEQIHSTVEWDTWLGFLHSPEAKFKYTLTSGERAAAIDAVRTGHVNSFHVELLPDLLRLGLIKEENGTKVPGIAYIPEALHQTFCDIQDEAAIQWEKDCLAQAVALCKQHKLPYPARITPVCNTHVYEGALQGLPMHQVYIAAEKGLITLEADKSYPVMFITQP